MTDRTLVTLRQGSDGERYELVVTKDGRAEVHELNRDQLFMLNLQTAQLLTMRRRMEDI